MVATCDRKWFQRGPTPEIICPNEVYKYTMPTVSKESQQPAQRDVRDCASASKLY